MIAVYIIVGLVIVFIGFGYFNMKRMKSLPNTPASEKIRILTNKNFKNQIRSGLVMVDFWAPWCGPCKMIAPTLNEIAESESDRFTIAKVNVDQQQQLAQKFKIRNIPTMIMFYNGKEVQRFAGVKTKKFLLKEAQTILDTNK